MNTTNVENLKNNFDSKHETSVEKLFQTIEDGLQEYYKSISDIHIKSIDSFKKILSAYILPQKQFFDLTGINISNKMLDEINTNLIFDITKFVEFQSQIFYDYKTIVENTITMHASNLENFSGVYEQYFKSNPFFIFEGTEKKDHQS